LSNKRHTRPTDLDVAAPDEVAGVLRAAAESYREATDALAAAWTDPHAGAVWGLIADVCDHAADLVERLVERYFASGWESAAGIVRQAVGRLSADLLSDADGDGGDAGGDDGDDDGGVAAVAG